MTGVQIHCRAPASRGSAHEFLALSFVHVHEAEVLVMEMEYVQQRLLCGLRSGNSSQHLR
jgi:hypothetical protein